MLIEHSPNIKLSFALSQISLPLILSFQLSPNFILISNVTSLKDIPIVDKHAATTKAELFGTSI